MLAVFLLRTNTASRNLTLYYFYQKGLRLRLPPFYHRRASHHLCEMDGAKTQGMIVGVALLIT